MTPETVVLVYHHVHEEPPASELAGSLHSVSVKNLKHQVESLAKRYKFVFAEEIFSRLQAGEDVKRLAAITFDDGYRSVLEHALPLLKSMRIPSHCFLCSSTLEGSVLWRDLIRELYREGLVQDFIGFMRGRVNATEELNAENFYRRTKDPAVFASTEVAESLKSYFQKLDRYPSAMTLYGGVSEWRRAAQSPWVRVGNHTESHFVLSSLADEQQRKEIVRSQEFLEAAKLLTSRVFSLPFGKPKDFNSDTVSILEALSIKMILGTAGSQLENAASEESANGLKPSWYLRRVLPPNEPHAFERALS